MAEFTTCEQMAKELAKKALDEFIYEGKTIREWVQIIAKQEPKTDILDEIKSEIKSKMEIVIGRYGSTTPMYDMASYKIERNKAREECIEIIDKYKQEA